MEMIEDVALRDFEFWSGATFRAAMLTLEELDQVEEQLPEILGDKPTETQVNDLFWFDFGTVCESIGLTYDEEKDEIVRK